MEQHYAFIKDNRVMNIAVFASQDEQLADAVAQEHGFDDAVWVGSDKPILYSTYDGVVFTPPTNEYLISIGLLPEPVIDVEEVTFTPAIEN
jgi:hypothetical protein